jgi:hypothetical protein
VVVTGQCVEFGTVGLPYVPLAGCFRGLAAAFGPDAVTEAAGAAEPALRAMIEGAPPVERDERMAASIRLDEVVTTLLEHLSSERPSSSSSRTSTGRTPPRSTCCASRRASCNAVGCSWC